MKITLQTLTKKQSKLYINFFGKAGSGKTFTALTVACALASSNDKVLIIDTENRSHYYANDFQGVLSCTNNITAKEPKISELLEIIDYAKKNAQIEVVVIDSLTPFWDKMVEYADNLANNNPKLASHGSNWKKAKQTIQTMTMGLRKSGLHVITTSLGKDETGENMKPTGKILPCFERTKFEPYLDIQVILHQNGTIFESVKSLHYELKDIFAKNTQINKDWVSKIQKWLDDGITVQEDDNLSKFIQKAQKDEEEDDATSKIKNIDVDVESIEIPEINEDEIVKSINNNNKQQMETML